MNDKKKQALDLLSQLVEKAQEEDVKYKIWCLRNHKAQRSEGESFMCFHLKILEELVKEI